jgi:hypothetical protein
MLLVFHNTSVTKNALQKINATNLHVIMMQTKTLFAILKSSWLAMTTTIAPPTLAMFLRVALTHSLLPTSAKNALKLPIVLNMESTTISKPSVKSLNAVLKVNVPHLHPTVKLVFLKRSALKHAPPPTSANLLDALMMSTRKFFAIM